MALTISNADLAHLEAAQDCLLSVAGQPHVQPWIDDVVLAVGRLFRSDRVMLLLPHFHGLELRSSPEMEPFLGPVRDVIAGLETGAVRYNERQVDDSQALRRSLGIEVWSNAMLEKLYGGPMEDTGWYYHEFIEPAGVADGGGLTVQLPRGEAMLLFKPGHPGRNPFGDGWLTVARLLLPSFKAAVLHLQQRQMGRDHLLRVLDQLDTALCLFDASGAEVHRNTAARELFRGEVEADRLLLAASATSYELARLRRRQRKTDATGPAAPGDRLVQLDSGRYRMRALYIQSHVIDIHDLVIVRLESLGPRLPPSRTLRERFGLTPRQAEVALLLARGASNRQIAEALGISPHTVRSHAESVFQKLNIHTRKALALRLLVGADTGWA